MRDESSELLESWKIRISRLPILIPAFKGKISTFDGGLSQVYSPVSSFHKRVTALLDPVFSPGRGGGENWQSSSFSGGVRRKEGVAQRVADFNGVSLGCWGDP
ncbi:hypothetical protein L2E82_30188 [Cichorium intybus]|uniref:Uncharacterized protein n=1 Tax=Cichorium intybus TaxID=13427 RepID=A0ACB9CZL5_CICIN|nr:hypothetical protein L2E82_30188 [Cichorium intybus]